MFRHVVMFKWRPGTGPAEVENVRRRLDELPRSIPAISVYRHGPDAGVNSGNFDYVVVGDFADVRGYLEYRDHPVHQQLITEVLAPLIAERAAVQYDFD